METTHDRDHSQDLDRASRVRNGRCDDLGGRYETSAAVTRPRRRLRDLDGGIGRGQLPRLDAATLEGNCEVGDVRALWLVEGDRGRSSRHYVRERWRDSVA